MSSLKQLIQIIEFPPISHVLSATKEAEHLRRTRQKAALVREFLQITQVRSIRDALLKFHQAPVDVQISLVTGFGDLKYRPSYPLLRELVQTNERLQISAAMAMSRLIDDRLGYKLIEECADTTDQFVVSALLKSLVVSDVSATVEQRLADFAIGIATDQEHPGTLRSDALEVVALCDYDRRTRFYKSIVSRVIELLDDFQPEVRASACYAVGILRIQNAKRKLRLMAASDHELAFQSATYTVSVEAKRSLDHMRGKLTR